jgi:hypothetical protein
VTNDGSGLAARIDVIESSYEYLLAYAAQGRQEDRGTEARPRLVAMYEALGGIAMEARAALGKGSPYDIGAFLDALDRDAAIARGAIGLVLRKAAIPSLLVDNLNASVHLRALLTDAFLIEQSLRPATPALGVAAASQ